MVLIIIILSTMIYIWVGPVFTGASNNGDNSQAAYLESFTLTQGSYIYSSQVGTEATRTAPSPWTPNTLCTGPINTPFTGNLLVPAGATCTVTAKVTGNIYAQSLATLIVNSTTVTGQIVGNYSLLINLNNANIQSDVSLYHINQVIITGGTITGNLYVGDRGVASMIGTTVTGDAEFEVNTSTYVVNNHVGGELEAEADGTAVLQGNTMTYTDFDGNGAAIFSGNTVNGNVDYGQDGWCASGGNIITGAVTSSCTGQVSVTIENTGPTPVTLRAVYINHAPSSFVSWNLGAGVSLTCGSIVLSTPCSQLPIVIPAHLTAQVTLTFTPPTSGVQVIGLDVYVVFVSTHSNYVDGNIYLGSDLSTPNNSRQLARVCPPCT
jgi:hypothetical protein